MNSHSYFCRSVLHVQSESPRVGAVPERVALSATKLRYWITGSLIALSWQFSAATAQAGGSEVVMVRSGYDEVLQASLVPCAIDVNVHCVPGPVAAPIQSTAFSAADFAAAKTSPILAHVVKPLTVWPQTLPADPLPRHIHAFAQAAPACSGGVPAFSTLFAQSFQVATPFAQTATVEFAWFIDDGLGDFPHVGANPFGLFLNGVSLGAQFSGVSTGQYVTKANVPIHQGTNTLYVYGRDFAGGASVALYSARITVNDPTEVVMVRSGYDELLQASLAPCALDNNIRCVTGPVGAPIQSTPFSAADFAAAQSSPIIAHVVKPLTVWPQTLPADPLSRHIHAFAQAVPACQGGSPAFSTLFAQSFEVTTPCAQTATVEFAWFIDDGLGDFPHVGANPIGLYVNGVAVGPQFGGGSNGQYVTQANVPIHQGTNTLHVYGRDFAGGAFVAIYSARLTVDLAGAAVSSTESVRLGTPPNPAALMPGLTSGPVISATWDPYIDHTTFVPASILDVLAITPFPANIPSPLGTILCDLSTSPLYYFSQPGVPFSVTIPVNCNFVGVDLCTQGASLDPSIVLANALDITIGSF
jgi:hypothetical protein